MKKFTAILILVALMFALFSCAVSIQPKNSGNTNGEITKKTSDQKPEDNKMSGDNSDAYIMTFDGEKIDMEEFKFFSMLLMQNAPADEEASSEIKKNTLEWLKSFLIQKKMAAERDISLSQENIDEIKENIQSFMAYYGFPYETLNISEERMIDLLDFILYRYLYYQLVDWFAKDYNLKANDETIALAVEEYRAESRFVKYIITNTKEEADEVRSELYGGLSVDEAVKLYSVLYDPNYEVEATDIKQLMQNLYSSYGILLSEENNNKVLELNALEFTETIDLSTNYGIFMPATAEEIEEWLKTAHESHEHGDEEFTQELEEFRLNDKLLKYIVTESKESAEEAYNALASGLSFEEAIKQYSVYYNESQGIAKLALSQSGISERYQERLRALQESAYSEVLALGPFAIFIEASESETAQWVSKDQAYQELLDKIEFTNNNVETETNQKIYDEFDAIKFYESLYPPEAE